MSILSRFRMLATARQGLARGISEADEGRDPIHLFQEWWAAAEDAGLLLPEAMALATAAPDGRPSVRMVLLKGLDERGFVFFTNYRSRKAREMERNPVASMCFHWAVLERQVRVEGTVARTSREESEAYFLTRPRGSRIGAWASEQSAELTSKEELLRRVEELEARHGGDEVPLPDFWGGYRLTPTAIEFWQGRPNRLHDRLVFSRASPEESWETRRLQP